MARLINADDLLQKLETLNSERPSSPDDWSEYGFWMMRKAIKSAPDVKTPALGYIISPGWISVKETFPREDESVLVTDGNTIQVNCYSNLYEQFGFWKWNGEKENYDWIKNGNQISHWQLLPSLPIE